jgi:endonuclease YncB( thermonuclease family)
MIEDGFAFAYLKYHFDRSEEYREAEMRARATGVGIWTHGDSPTRQQQPNPARRYQSVRVYVIGVLVFLLVCVGAYFYIRR